MQLENFLHLVDSQSRRLNHGRGQDIGNGLGAQGSEFGFDLMQLSLHIDELLYYECMLRNLLDELKFSTGQFQLNINLS